MSAGRKRSTVWLATLSTVVGVATGMFTLRDQVLHPGGTEAEASMPEYQRSIDPICDVLNRTESRRPRDVKRLRRELGRATTPLGQRDALMISVRRTLADSDRQLAKFKALHGPEQIGDRHDDTAAAWERNVERLRGHESRLDDAEDQRDIVRAIKTFSRARHVMGRDANTRDTGLERLAGGRCLDEPQVTAPVSLPALAQQPGDGSRSTGSPAVGPDAGPSPDAEPGTGPDVTPHAAPAPEAPGAGGGELAE